MKRPGRDDEVDVLDRVVGRVGVGLVVEHQEDAGHERDQERRHRGDPEAPRRRPAQAPAVRPHGVQVEEDVAEDERRARRGRWSGRRRETRTPSRGAARRFRLWTRRRSARSRGPGRARRRSCLHLRPRRDVLALVDEIRPAAARDLAARRGRAAPGPSSTAPSCAKREPWQGHSKPSAPGFTMQPRCVQTVETAKTPSASRKTATMRPGGTKASPGGSVSGQRDLELLRGRGQDRGLGQPQRAEHREEQRRAAPPRAAESPRKSRRGDGLGVEPRARGWTGRSSVMRSSTSWRRSRAPSRSRPSGSAWRRARSGCSGPRP